MLRGQWPRTSTPGTDAEALVDEAVAAQVEAGCDLVTDGQVRWADPVAAVLQVFRAGDIGVEGMLARAFRDTAARVPADTGTVAQVVPGPYSLALRDVGEFGDQGVVNGQALAFAAVLAGELVALRDAGCGVVIIDEPAAVAIRSEQARDGWLTAHRRMLRDAGGPHLMLSIAGGDATGLGGPAIASLPYASVLVDLVAGPDNWYLVRDLPGDRGIVCAALAAEPGRRLGDQSPQLVWAAQYAASMSGRSLARVGLANATSLAALTPAEARAALDALVAAARYADMPLGEALAAGLDERAWRTMRRPAPGRQR